MERFWRHLIARFAQTGQQGTEEFPLDVLYAKGPEDVEMTSYYIRSRRFGRQLLGGLNPEEVAAFLDEVAEALQTAQTLHIEMGAQVKVLQDQVQALAIKQASVAPSDPSPSAERPATAHEAPATSRLEVLRNTALQEVEALLHDAQARAQAMTDAAQERAAIILREADAVALHRQKEAEQLIAEAAVTAESIVTTARDEEASLRHELDRLAEGRLRMLDDVWATLNGCRQWLATLDPRGRAPEERDGRLDRVA